MKRWFIARMYVTADCERLPAVARHTNDFRVWSNDTSDLCVGQVAFKSIDPLQADPDVHLFPDQMLMDFRWDSIGAAARDALIAKAQAMGFDTSAIGPNAANRDAIIHSLVHQVQAGINVEQGDVRDPWG